MFSSKKLSLEVLEIAFHWPLRFQKALNIMFSVLFEYRG